MAKNVNTRSKLLINARGFALHGRFSTIFISREMYAKRFGSSESTDEDSLSEI